MDLTLNSLQRLICHKTQPANQNKNMKISLLKLHPHEKYFFTKLISVINIGVTRQIHVMCRLSSRHLQRAWHTCTKLHILYSGLICIRGQTGIVKTRRVDMGILIFFLDFGECERWNRDCNCNLYCEHNWNQQHKWWLFRVVWIFEMKLDDFYCYFHNVLADMSSGLLQVFVELGNLHGTSNYVLREPMPMYPAGHIA